MMPHYRANPYQRLLADALARQGVRTFLVSHWDAIDPRTLLRVRPQVLHLQWLEPYYSRSNAFSSFCTTVAFLVALLSLRIVGVRIVWTVHNVHHHERRYPALNALTNHGVAMLSHAVVTHSASIKHVVCPDMHLRPDKVAIIPAGNFCNYRNDIGRAQARTLLGLPANAFVFLFLGHLRRYKGVDALIETFKTLRGEELRLVVAGERADDTYMRRLSALARHDDRVMVRGGFIADDEIQTFMNACDVVVLPYVAIDSSGSLLLAMSFGKPCICPVIGSIPETIGDARLLYDPHDKQGLWKALSGATQRSDLVEIGTRNLEKARTFDWDIVAVQTKDVYAKVTGMLRKSLRK